MGEPDLGIKSATRKIYLILILNCIVSDMFYHNHRILLQMYNRMRKTATQKYFKNVIVAEISHEVTILPIISTLKRVKNEKYSCTYFFSFLRVKIKVWEGLC